MKKIQLIKSLKEHYPLDIPYEEVYQIVNEDMIPIGVVYFSQLPFEDEIYMEWLELLTGFRGKGYLRYILKEIKDVLYKNIQFQCDDKLRKKYLQVGCTEHGISKTTENYIMSY